MPKYANAGEMRTPILIENPVREATSNGYIAETWKNPFGDGVTLRAKWVNVHGTEVFEAMGLDLREPATLTLRYTDKITIYSRILKAADIGKPDQKELYYEVISVDDIDERHAQMELKIQRKRSAP